MKRTMKEEIRAMKYAIRISEQSEDNCVSLCTRAPQKIAGSCLLPSPRLPLTMRKTLRYHEETILISRLWSGKESSLESTEENDAFPPPSQITYSDF
ncbi:hypothetical protein TNCV_4523001 [Trichonephila clavipes]|nr:hypothetical protein TNCV_4523001 [Trichonephila clavipes]